MKTKDLPQIDGITVHCAHDSIVPVGDLKPYPRNNKTHPEAQISLMCKAIKAQGWRAPVTVSNQSGYIVRGHGRLEAAKRLGLKAVPVDYQNYASTAAEQADRIADNKLAELAEWDLPALKEELLELDTGAFDMDVTGFDESSMENLMTQFHPDEKADAEPHMDRAAELNKKWNVKPGDLWLIGDHRLLCGDSTKADDVGRLLGDRKPMLMVTDPPYGVEYCPEWRAGAKAKGKVTNDDRAGWSAAYGLSRANVAYVWHAGIYATTVHRELESAGFELRCQIVWVKNRIPMSRGHYHWAHEPCWYAVRKGESGAWSGGRKQKTVWGNIIDGFNKKDESMFATRIDAETVYAFPASATTVWEIKHDSACDGGHSTQKPQECMARPMRNHNAQEVYDPFLGSGTTMVAAQNLGRKCYGNEIAPGYCAVIMQRMTDAFPGIKIKRAP